MANPLVGAAGISAGGSIIGGAMSSKAAKSAARTQAASADYAAQLQQERLINRLNCKPPSVRQG